MNGSKSMPGPGLRLVGLALCGALAACQRPTQLLPPAPIFDMRMPGAPQADRGGDGFPPSLRADDRTATTADVERFAGISRIYFEHDSAELTDEARGILDRQAEWLRRHPDARASLQGHADMLGTREHQIALGEKRAAAMKLHLMSRGVTANRLAITSFGKQRPAVLARDEANQKMNRRGETVLTGVPGASGN